MLHMSKNRLFNKNHVWSPASLGDQSPTRIRKDVSGGLLQYFLLPFSTLPLNKKGMSLHATCNSMHSPCNLHKRHATPCMWHATPCIRHAPFACAMKTHACTMQLHACAMHPLYEPCKLMHAPWNSMHAPCTLCMCYENSCMHHETPCICSATPLKLNRLQTTQLVLMHLASIIKFFDFCLANCTCHQEPLRCWTLAPMHSALAVNSDPRSSI